MKKAVMVHLKQCLVELHICIYTCMAISKQHVHLNHCLTQCHINQPNYTCTCMATLKQHLYTHKSLIAAKSLTLSPSSSSTLICVVSGSTISTPAVGSGKTRFTMYRSMSSRATSSSVRVKFTRMMLGASEPAPNVMISLIPSADRSMLAWLLGPGTGGDYW